MIFSAGSRKDKAVLDIKNGEKTYEALKHCVEELEREIPELKQVEKTRRRQNNYLTALQETFLGFIDNFRTTDVS